MWLFPTSKNDVICINFQSSINDITFSKSSLATLNAMNVWYNTAVCMCTLSHTVERKEAGVMKFESMWDR